MTPGGIIPLWGGAIISESEGGIIPLQGGGIIPEFGGGFLRNQHIATERSSAGLST